MTLSESQRRQRRAIENAARAQMNAAIFQRPVTMRYYQRVSVDDENFIREFVVFAEPGHSVDPEMQLIWEPTPGDPSVRHYWAKREEGDLVVFRPPDGYDGGPVIFWYDRTQHWVEAYKPEPEKTYSFPTSEGKP